MIQISVFIDDKAYRNVDISHPENGNPGIGGTEYCFANLIYALKKYTDFNVQLFHTGNNIFPYCNRVVVVSDIFEAITQSQMNNSECFIYRFEDNESIYRALDSANLRSIAWAHNYFPYDAAKRAGTCNCLKAIVAVGKQQYDKYIDDDISSKMAYIYNIVESQGFEQSIADTANGVTYTGAIVRGKGFHVLAKNWKKILKEVPTAELYVIGTGTLYHHDCVMGKYNIAEKNYENSFISYLMDDNMNILPSVHFMGKLGQEKVNIYRKSRVGIINPTAKTETFGLGAVEMQSCGVPVVLKNKNGFPDVVQDSKTGFTFFTERQMRKKIIRLLNDPQLARDMGNSGIEFSTKMFTAERISKDWIRVIEACVNDNPLPYVPPNKAFLNNLKFFRILNRYLRFNLHLKKIPSLLLLEYRVRKILKK